MIFSSMYHSAACNCSECGFCDKYVIMGQILLYVQHCAWSCPSFCWCGKRYGVKFSYTEIYHTI